MLLQGDYYLYYNLLYKSTTHDICMLITVNDVFMLLTEQKTGPSACQQIKRWIILHCISIVKGK